MASFYNYTSSDGSTKEVYSPDNPPPFLVKEYGAHADTNGRNYWRFAGKRWRGNDHWNSGSFLVSITAIYDNRKTALVSCNWRIGGSNFECDLYVLAGDDISQGIGWYVDSALSQDTVLSFYIRDVNTNRDTYWKVTPIVNNTKNGEIVTFYDDNFNSYLVGGGNWRDATKAIYKG